ncbi:T9SS type A sorting domain-containing protein [Flavobacterium microcysteis]
MRKTTFAFFATLLSGFSLTAQTYSTGTVTLTTGFTAKIDVTSSLVTLTFVGPSTDWLGLSFNATSMNNNGSDVVIFDGTNMTDRTFAGIGATPPLDASQNWTVTANTINAGVRTVTATRARDTGDSNDYAFSASAQALNLAWAHRPGSLAMGYHGSGNSGATVANFALGTESFTAESFKLYPNPAKGFTTVELPDFVSDGEIKVYDSLGRVVRTQAISETQATISTSGLTTGSYMVVVRTNYGNATKTLMVE